MNVNVSVKNNIRLHYHVNTNPSDVVDTNVDAFENKKMKLNMFDLAGASDGSPSSRKVLAGMRPISKSNSQLFGPPCFERPESKSSRERMCSSSGVYC